MRKVFRTSMISLVGFIFGIILFLVAIFAHFWALAVNYSGVAQSFDLLGYDQKPLADDALFGWIFESVGLGDATQCNLYAGFLVLAIALGIGGAFHYIFCLIDLIRDRGVYRSIGDNNSVRLVDRTILYQVLPLLALFSILVGIVGYWDVILFQFRSLAGISGIERSEEAGNISLLGVNLREYPDNLALNLVQLGSWGYLAATFVTALFIKFSTSRIKESFSQLLPDDDTAQDTRQEQNNLTTQTQETNTIPTQLQQEKVQNNNQEQETNNQDINNSTEQQQTFERVNVEVPRHTDDMEQQIPTSLNKDEMVDIIGGNGPIPMAEAISNTEKYHKDGDGRFWEKSFYEGLHK